MSTQLETRGDWRGTVQACVHDLRNYLNSISGWCYVLQTYPLTDEEREAGFEHFKTAFVMAQTLTENLLSVALDESQVGRPAKTLVGLEDLAREAASLFKPLALQKGILLVCDAAPGRTLVEADPHQLGRVFANLLSNAIKFTPVGGKIVLSVRGDGRWARAEVSDTGIGISQEKQKRIFEKFYQIHPHNHGSLGLGLYIARKIVRAHGGRMGAESEGEGKGSTLWFALRDTGGTLVSACTP